MSIASMSGYLPLQSANPAVNPAFALTVIEIPLEAPVATATSASFTAIDAFVVPKGTWLLSGDVGIATTVNTNQIPEWITSVNKNATLLMALLSFLKP
jgi:hypothetical protein